MKPHALLFISVFDRFCVKHDSGSVRVLGVCGTQGTYKLGIRYRYPEIWAQIRYISCFLTTNFDITNSTSLSILGTLGDFLGILGPF